MADFPLSGSQITEVTADGGSGSNYGTALALLPSSGTANTAGSWVTLISSTAFESQGMFLWLESRVASGGSKIDIAIGSAGNEEIIIPGVPVRRGAFLPGYVYLPIYIPAGVRIAGRITIVVAASVSDAGVAGVTLFGMTDRSNMGYSVTGVNYGATGSNYGVSLTASTTGGTKNAWTEITSATSNFHKFLLFTLVSNNNDTGLSNNFLLDIGVGASGSEELLIENMMIMCHSDSNYTFMPFIIGPIIADVASGSRLSARIALEGTQSTNNPIASIIGF